MLDDDDDFGDVGQDFVQQDNMDANSIAATEYAYFLHTQNHGSLMCYYTYSDDPEAVIQNSDPQNDSVLLYDEVSGELKALEEG